MFSVLDTKADHNCSGFTRREFLRIGGLGMGGLTLANLLAAQAQGDSRFAGKSVVLLFLQGGPPHIEMFDPKMEAPIEFRSTTGEVQTNLPGVTFGGTYPRLARMADKLAIVRSYASMNSGHEYRTVVTGNNPLQAAMGAMHARVVGATNRETGLPSNVLILPEAVQPGLRLGSNFETGALPGLTDPGQLGASFAAFNPSGGGPLQQNMAMRIPQERFDDRRSLLGQFDTMRRDLDRSGRLETLDSYQQQAYDVILRGVANSFDLSKEDPRTIERYDTSRLFRLEDVHRWGDMRRSSNLLGKQMLLARRLCEAGCGFVTVSDCGWDFHSNNNSPPNLGGLRFLGPQVDHAVAAFIEDVEQRGLSDKILLVVTGEMGRTPRLNGNGGRDHYGNLTSLLLAGGGLRMGQVIGRSDRNASNPTTERYTPANLFATIMHTLMDVAQLRIRSDVPKNISDILANGTPIAGL